MKQKYQDYMDARERVAEHMVGCGECQQLVGDLSLDMGLAMCAAARRLDEAADKVLLLYSVEDRTDAIWESLCYSLDEVGRLTKNDKLRQSIEKLRETTEECQEMLAGFVGKVGQ